MVRAAALIALLFSTTAQSQEWLIREYEDGCTMSMDFVDEGSSEVVLFLAPDDTVMINVNNSNWSAARGINYEMTVALDENIYVGTAHGTLLHGRRGVATSMPAEFLRDFARARNITLLRGQTIMAHLSLERSAAGVARLQQCAAQVGRERAVIEERRRFIPVDPFANEVPNEAEAEVEAGTFDQFVTMDDYPASALRAGQEGDVGVTLTLGQDGRVTNCAVTEPSPFPVLNDATCRNLQRRARFAPFREGIDPPGPRTLTRRISWRLP